MSRHTACTSTARRFEMFDRNEFRIVHSTRTEWIRTHSPRFGYLIDSLQRPAVIVSWLGIASAGLVLLLVMPIIVDRSNLFRTERPNHPAETLCPGGGSSIKPM